MKVSLKSQDGKNLSQKLWCSSSNNQSDFSKEIIFQVNDESLKQYSINIQLKKSAGFGIRSRVNQRMSTIFCLLFQMRFSVKSTLVQTILELGEITGRR